MTGGRDRRHLLIPAESCIGVRPHRHRHRRPTTNATEAATAAMPIVRTLDLEFLPLVRATPSEASLPAPTRAAACEGAGTSSRNVRSADRNWISMTAGPDDWGSVPQGAA